MEPPEKSQRRSKKLDVTAGKKKSEGTNEVPSL